MSRSVDLFIDANVPLDELAGALGRHTGSSLVPEADQARWVLQEGDIRATLAEHPYGDDGDLPFSRYRFALSARVSNDVRPMTPPKRPCCGGWRQKIQQATAWPVLLVHDFSTGSGSEAGAARGVGSGVVTPSAWRPGAGGALSCGHETRWSGRAPGRDRPDGFPTRNSPWPRAA